MARASVWLALALFSWVVPTSAWGHQQFAPSTVNRYGKLILSASHGVRVSHTLMVGAVPAQTLRQGADRDRNGRLDADEQALLCRRLGSLTRQGLSLHFDGQPLAIAWDKPQCVLSGTATEAGDSLGALPLSVELAARLPPLHPDPAEHSLRYEDRVALPPIGEVELRIEDSPEVTLLSSFAGAAPDPSPTQAGPTQAGQNTAPQRVFVTFGPPRSSISDRSISLRVRRSEAAVLPAARPYLPQLPRWPLWIALIAGVAALLSRKLQSVRR